MDPSAGIRWDNERFHQDIAGKEFKLWMGGGGEREEFSYKVRMGPIRRYIISTLNGRSILEYLIKWAILGLFFIYFRSFQTNALV